MVKKSFKNFKENFKDNMKYLFPTNISNKHSLGLRKRWLHKGFQLYKYTKIGDEMMHEHIVHTNTLKQTNIYLKNEYNITID